MQTYRTQELAVLTGVHPNTVRLYEKLQFITQANRKENGYRAFTELQVLQIRFAQLALRREVLHHGLRDQALYIIQLCAKLDFQEAIQAVDIYISSIEEELVRARSSISDVQAILNSKQHEQDFTFTRKQAAKRICVTLDTLRNWELKCLNHTERKQNGYRIYDGDDLRRLCTIRTLRLASYSLMSILRLLNQLDEHAEPALEMILNTPSRSEDIISVCDRLVVSLEAACDDAKALRPLLREIMQASKPSIPPDFG
jgi:DNA-binding transcriptional MerR regulator